MIEVTDVVVPRVTCDLPVHPISFDSRWDHLSGVKLADPDFGRSGKIGNLVTTLKTKHGNQFTTVQYRLWAEMLDVGTYRCVGSYIIIIVAS